MHVHATGAAYYAHAGEWRKLLTDTSYGNPVGAGYTDPLASVAYSGTISSLTDVSTATPSAGQVLKWDASTGWTPASDNTGSGGSGIALTDLSVTKNSAGSADLAYNNTSGVFTYTPPDLSSYLTSVGTLSSHTDVSTNSPTNGQVLKWNSTASEWQPQADNAGSGGGISNVVEDTSPQLGGDLDVNGKTIAHTFNVVNDGASDYRFSDSGNIWFPTAEDDPVLYLRRGEQYRFVVNASGHPFQIRVSNGGSPYSTGVTNNGTQSGTIIFKVPMSAPATLYYQCTIHAGMGNTINIV